MKIAVASGDGTSISRHFGRSKCFIVFEVEAREVVGRVVRENTYTAHAQGECQDGEGHHHDRSHSHAGIVNALRDCDAVLCYGMGWRAAEELANNGIKPSVVEEEVSPEEAVNRYLAGKLKAAGNFCRCHE